VSGEYCSIPKVVFGNTFRPGGSPEGVGTLDHQRIDIHVFRRTEWLFLFVTSITKVSAV
jgi:hypothetical protein